MLMFYLIQAQFILAERRALHKSDRETFSSSANIAENLEISLTLFVQCKRLQGAFFLIEALGKCLLIIHNSIE